MSSNFTSLKKRSQFLNLRKKGKSVKSKFFIFNFSKNSIISPEKISRIGITVSKKNGNAVKRNYIRRVIKALITQNKTFMPVGLDIEIIPRTTFLEFRFVDIQNDLLNFQNSALK